MSYLEELVKILLGNGIRATPDDGRTHRLDIKPGDDTKVAAATLQRPEQIFVLVLVGLHQRPIGQHDLIVDDAVAGPADLVSVEADTTGQQETGDTNGTDTAAGDTKAVGFKVCIDVGPALRDHDLDIGWALRGKERSVGA